EIDTYAPRVIQQMQPISNTNRYRYTIQVDDNNMDAAAIQTPCGASLVSTFSAPQSILNDSTNMLFDGTLRKQTHMEGACELGSTPLITKLPDFPLSHTDVAVAGQRLQYIGGQNELIVVDSQSLSSPVRQRMPIQGRVTQLLMSANKQTLYVISDPLDSDTDTRLTIFDIS
ncbi:MAG: hypothetical protein ACK45X_16125, partial [Roseiflexaceae bacterium]